MRFIATTSDKINSIPVVSGQMIFSKDDRVIYLDSNERTSFQQIAILVTESQRQNLTDPIPGFYFVKETKMLWNFDDNTWIPISGGGAIEPQIIFGDTESLPEQGVENKLYIDKKHIYQWDSSINQYVLMNVMQWDNMK